MRCCTFLLVLTWMFISCTNACHFYHYDLRRKRNVKNEVQDTAHLRAYFTACMKFKLPYSSYDWESLVDFTILDSIWHLDTHQVFCSPAGGTPTSECWKNSLNEYIISNSDTSVQAKQCITDYAEDEPLGENRYANRKKRNILSQSGFPGFQSYGPPLPQLSTKEDYKKLTTYATCLETTAPNVSDIQTRTNYQQLSKFIKKETIVGCNDQRAFQKSNFWPYKFIVLTRSDSKLRKTLNVCGKKVFPPDSFWSSWSKYSDCQSSCRQNRTRSCRSGVNPREVANDCRGSNDVEEKSCVDGFCSLGNWSPWQPWSSCSEACGKGIQSRQRLCNFGIHNAFPNNGCPGSNIQSRGCNNPYSPWERWGTCTSKCTRSRRRICSITRVPQTVSQSCRGQSCPKGYSWNKWSSYGKCSRTCGGGTRRRTRGCLLDYGRSNGGKRGAAVTQCKRFLSGSSSSTQRCNPLSCPSGTFGSLPFQEIPLWAPWSPWSSCKLINKSLRSVCGNGNRSRTRKCQFRSLQITISLCRGISESRQKCTVRC